MIQNHNTLISMVHLDHLYEKQIVIDDGNQVALWKRERKLIIVDPRIECFGWKTSVQFKRGSAKITINKIIATGTGLEKGQYVYCYIAKDRTGRPMILVYLDGKPRTKT